MDSIKFKRLLLEKHLTLKQAAAVSGIALPTFYKYVEGLHEMPVTQIRKVVERLELTFNETFEVFPEIDFLTVHKIEKEELKA